MLLTSFMSANTLNGSNILRCIDGVSIFFCWRAFVLRSIFVVSLTCTVCSKLIFFEPQRHSGREGHRETLLCNSVFSMSLWFKLTRRAKHLKYKSALPQAQGKLRPIKSGLLKNCLWTERGNDASCIFCRRLHKTYFLYSTLLSSLLPFSPLPFSLFHL